MNMRFDTETFIFKADTEGLVLKNREEYHYGTTDTGLLHDIFEHPYRLISNPYLDEIAALGAFNEYRCSENNGDILSELRFAVQSYLADDRCRFKWSYRYITELSSEINELIDWYKDTEDSKFIDKYKYLFSYYFNLGATIFHNRFNNYFNSYSDLYYGLGDEVITKLTPLINTDLDYIKLTINYKHKEVKVEY